MGEQENGASPDGDRAATASQPSPAVSGIAGIPSAGETVFVIQTPTETLRIQADHYEGHGAFVGFYVITGDGTETASPSWFRRTFLRAKPIRRRVQSRESVAFVRTNAINIITWEPASGIEATTDASLPTRNAGDAR